MAKENPEISIILPCRNEEQALPFCLKRLKEVIKENNLSAEVIVSDSSTDKSPQIARKEKVVLIKHGKDGYGNACTEGFKAAKGKYVVMADADASYDFSKIPALIRELKSGSDMVIANRLDGKIEKGAMPALNRHLGTPLLSLFLKIFFKSNIKDSQSGMRAIKRDCLKNLNLQTTGMEFASEMIIKALKNNLKIKEIPVDYYKRKGASKLKPFPDAWRHLRFMLLYSPLFLFFIPGLILFSIGAVSMLWIYFGNPIFFGLKIYHHPLFISSALIILGYQLILFSGFAKIYSITHLGESNEKIEKLFKYITIEKAAVAGLAVFLLGAAIYLFIFVKWAANDFGSLNEIKNASIALTFLTLGAQTFFSSFVFSILGIKEK